MIPAGYNRILFFQARKPSATPNTTATHCSSSNSCCISIAGEDTESDPTTAGRYSVLKLLTGFNIPARSACQLTVNNVITSAPTLAAAKTHHDNGARYSYCCNHLYRK